MNQRFDAAECWQALRASPADAARWWALVCGYIDAGLVWQAAYCARQVLRLDPSRRAEIAALRPGVWWDASVCDGLLGRATLHDAAVRGERFAAQAAASPGDWLTHLYLARIGELTAAPSAGASASALRARATEPVGGETDHWLGVWRLNAGDALGAVAALRPLVDVAPKRFGSFMYLGEALLRVGRGAEAEQAFARASLSNNPAFLLTLAEKVYAHNYWQEAIDVLKKAISLRADFVAALIALAKIQSEVYALADCSVTLGRIEVLEPDNREARLLRAGLQGRMGDAREHFALLQRQYDETGDPLSRMASSVAMTALYHDLMTPAEVAALHRRLCAGIEAVIPASRSFSNEREPHRRLRLGYVTGDLHRQHPVNIFMLPMLKRHDHSSFDVSIFHTGTMFDDYTRQAKASVDRWVECAAMGDAELHRTIGEERIDILIDLAGHTSSHRLGVFAMRAAPVQVTFLGYPHSTGLATIDWLIGDPVVSPASHAELFSEGIAQLPQSVFCWAPVDDYPLPVPRAVDAPIVFGSFNNAMKLSPRTLALWARVLAAVPGSRLLLKAPSLGDAAVQSRFARIFAAHGIEAERLGFRGPSGLQDMMAQYGDVDIALDPLPYNGGTTTLQALWMGVPVVTLAGGNFVGRMGASFMTALGAATWIARDEDQYVEIACGFAARIADVRPGRSALRDRMASSALCDIGSYMVRFEALLREMWRTYCSNEGRRLIAPAERDFKESTMTSSTSTPPNAPAAALEISTSRQLLAWFAEQKLSLAFTTYQIGKLFLLGLKDNGELSAFERTFNRCMGLAPTPNGFYLSSLHQVWRFENVFLHGERQDGYDRLYVPQVGNTTGDIDIHDMAVDADGTLLFVNTLFGCLATLSETHSFKPIWRPRFISRLAAEDRCHLNGLAMKEGRAGYVTAVSESDVVDGWRDHRADGGIVIDVASGEIAARGLSMPHSPRWYRDRLWLHNSGTGEFGHVELDSGRFVPLAFCPGYLRGLCFHGDFAVVGLSKPRHNKTFSGLPLDARLAGHNAEPRCGLYVIDLRNGDVVHWLRLEGIVDELYDIVVLPGVRRPMALGFVTDEIRRVISIEE